MTACPRCGNSRHYMLYPKGRLTVFTCFECGEDTPYERDEK